MDYFICGEKFLDFYFFKSIFLLARTPLCNLKLFDRNIFFYVNELFDFRSWDPIIQCIGQSFFSGARSDHYLLSQNWARSYHYLFASKMSQIRSWSRSDHSRSFLKLRFTTSHHYFSTKLTLPTLFITFLCINFLQRLKNWKNFLNELWKKLWKKFSYKKILV